MITFLSFWGGCSVELFFLGGGTDELLFLGGGTDELLFLGDWGAVFFLDGPFAEHFVASFGLSDSSSDNLPLEAGVSSDKYITFKIYEKL